MTSVIVRPRRISPDDIVLPPPTAPARRLLKHPRLMHYNRLIVFVLALNIAVFVIALTRGWWRGSGIALGAIAVTAQANFALAIIVRQQYVINLVCKLATSAPTSWPLRIRWALAKVYHFGGLHVGAAISGTLWYVAFVGSLIYMYARGGGNVSPANVAVSAALVTLFVVMVIMAMPPLRARAHDRFEITHRFCGWAALALVWVNTVLFAGSQRGNDSTARALVHAPTIWIITLTTAFAAFPWLLLRKVPITVHRPSRHVALIGFDHGVSPFIGSSRAISRNPLLGWHSFANVPDPARPGGYRMAVSRAGDWTAAFI